MNDKLEIIKRCNKGESVIDLAKEFKISRSRVYQIINYYKNCHAKNRQQVEDAVREKMANEGWIVMKNGYPDFFCYNPELNKYKFIEVKGNGNPRPNQSKMIDYLQRAGFEVEVIKGVTNDKEYLTCREYGKRGWTSMKRKLLEKAQNYKPNVTPPPR